jgi:hypothetical protein
MSQKSVRRIAGIVLLALVAIEVTACFGPFRRDDRRDERQERRD